jgi:hypothetical protein
MKHPHEWLQNYYWLKSTSHETFSTSDYHDVLMGYRSQVNVPSPKLFRPSCPALAASTPSTALLASPEGGETATGDREKQPGNSMELLRFTKYQENYGLWCTLVYCHGIDNSPITWTPIHEWIQY